MPETTHQQLVLAAAAANRYRGAWIRHRVLAENAMGERYLGDLMAQSAAEIAQRREELFRRVDECLRNQTPYEPTLEDVIAFYEGDQDR